MTVALLRARPANDEELARRARRGDRRAHRTLVNKHAPRAVELIGLLVGEGADTTELSSLALSAAIAAEGPLDDALVRSAVDVATRWRPDDAGVARLVMLLTEIEGRSGDDVAALVGRSPADVAELRAAARRDVGLPVYRLRRCRGWPLSAARTRVTDSERAAADGHLAICRSCRQRLHERDAARTRLLARGAAVGGLVAADVAAITAPIAGGGLLGGLGATIGGLVAGAPALAAIGGAALAVAAAVGITAATHESGSRPPSAIVRGNGASGAAGGTSGTGSGAGTSGTGSSGAPGGSQTGGGGGSLPDPSGNLTVAPTTPAPDVSLPGINLGIPTLPLPSPSLTLDLGVVTSPLPSNLVSPTSVPLLPGVTLSPVPLPSTSLLSPLPTLSTSPLPVVSSLLSPLPTLSPPPLLP